MCLSYLATAARNSDRTSSVVTITAPSSPPAMGRDRIRTVFGQYRRIWQERPLCFREVRLFDWNATRWQVTPQWDSVRVLRHAGLRFQNSNTLTNRARISWTSWPEEYMIRSWPTIPDWVQNM